MISRREATELPFFLMVYASSHCQRPQAIPSEFITEDDRSVHARLPQALAERVGRGAPSGSGPLLPGREPPQLPR